jgi:predicted small secreted protein
MLHFLIGVALVVGIWIALTLFLRNERPIWREHRVIRKERRAVRRAEIEASWAAFKDRQDETSRIELLHSLKVRRSSR